MGSLYNIEQELLEIYQELEENGGELTPELEEKLVISQENFKTKLNDYVNVINDISAKVDACKAEEKRIATLRKSRENCVARLKSAIGKALVSYGQVNKSGNYFMDLDTCKVATRSSESIQFDEQRIEDLIYCVTYCINDESIKFDDNINDVLKRINYLYSTILVNRGATVAETVLFTQDDLVYLRVNVGFNINTFSLLTDEVLCRAIRNNLSVSIQHATSKSDIKNGIKKDDVTFAHTVVNDSVQIK